ncbi:hypothetical protein [Xanthovirga aplysinae]|uniref:hypothetical protein n=1 Tax=Xanthovirga aplysinae TaxID=2529853 RepID=UPI0012BCCD59|nr:hypothetical protein [Xanthovirga aplysinae]MTI30444.1 hypothetical protein [Xanthovirga aplysinae]
MDLKQQVGKIDSLVEKGAIVDAVKTYFADNAHTSDYGHVEMNNKAQQVRKLEDFTGSIKNINSIKHHRTVVEGNVSDSEFTFDFDMKDGSKIHWHEIIRRKWNNDGKIINEEYFNAE